MFPVIQRYAKQIQQRYDVLLLPNGIETMIYAGMGKPAPSARTSRCTTTCGT